MNQHLTDELIRSAIARRVTAAAEGDLRGRILAATAVHPQRRGWRVRLDGEGLIRQRGLTLRLAVALVLLATVALVAVLVGHPDRPAPAPLGGLAYLSHGDLWASGPAGESPRLVWDSPDTEVLSGPMRVDAETILVSVHRRSDGEFLVYVVDTANSTRRLVDRSSDLLALSPDRLRIATARDIAGAASRLQIVDLATGDVVDIGSVEALTPLSWSPDDQWLLGEGSRWDSGNLIYRVDLGAHSTDKFSDLATGLCCGLHQPRPVLSPDGSRVVFVDYYEAAQGEICDFRCGTLWSLDPATGERLQLTATEGSEIGPVFSPDGAWIAFMEWVGTGYDIAVVRADGTGRRKLTETGNAFAPAANLEPYRYLFWDADGLGLMFMRWPEGAQTPDTEFELWHVTLDGQIEERIGTFVVSEFSR